MPRKKIKIVHITGPSKTEVFDSLFPPHSELHTSPTPIATPDLGFTGPDQSFGGLAAPFTQHAATPTAAQLQVQRSRAWSTATRFLSLVIDQPHKAHDNPTQTRTAKTRDVEEAIEFLIAQGSIPNSTEDDLLQWFKREIRNHFKKRLCPAIQELWKSSMPTKQPYHVLRQTARILSDGHSWYQEVLNEHILPVMLKNETPRDDEVADAEQYMERILAKFEQYVREMFRHSVPSSSMFAALEYVTYDYGSKMFQIHGFEDDFKQHRLHFAAEAGGELLTLVHELQKVGLGGRPAHIAFSHGMDHLMEDFIRSDWMKVDWNGRHSVIKKLRTWVQHGFAPFTKTLLNRMNDGSLMMFTDEHVDKLVDMAVERLGRYRTECLFDFVCRWDESKGAILDLKEYITTIKARRWLTMNFLTQLSQRLLHAGATTTDILNVYIYTFRVFIELDPRGVLLESVSRSIRHYLKSREDTTRIIISSLLADPDAERLDADVSLEIAKEMQQPITALQDHDYELDWDNMDWMPDPIDAGPEFRRTKVEDVFTHLFNLFDRENLIDELKSILGEFLLRANETSDFEKVIKLLELFKSRIGEDKLQSCEVMLNDIETSRRINTAVHQSKPYTTDSEQRDQPETNAQVLSAFFWPTLRDLHIKMPEPMRRIQKVYEMGFQSIKDMRRVEWMNALGRIEVELQFEDRVIQEKVTPLVAAVIQCFDQDNGKRRIDASWIADQLEIYDQDIVRNALDFWVNKGVLRKYDATGETYEVVERLDGLRNDDALASSAAADNEQQALINQNAMLYKQFIIAMLTNNGSLPVSRISMMLKIALPGGFPFSNDLLESLLKSMVKEKELVTQGGVFGIRRP